MSRAAVLLVASVIGCAAVAPPVPVVLPVAEVPSARPVSVPLAAGPADPAPARTLPLHRFAALVPGEAAVLYPVGGRALLRTGERLFSLSPGEMHRELALEKALAEPTGRLGPGAVGGHSPDGLVTDRLAPATDDGPGRRIYVRLGRGKETEISRPQRDARMVYDATTQVVELPGGRLLAKLVFDGPEQSTLGWLDFIPGPRAGREQGLHGIENTTGRPPALLQRADGGVVLAASLGDDQIRLVSWATGGADPEEIQLGVEGYEPPRDLLETTAGELFLLTDKGLYRQIGKEMRKEDAGAPLASAWPLPDGTVLLVTEKGDALVRGVGGTFARAAWPVVSIEGRQFEVSFMQAVCTRASGFWAIARDGAGLYHDRAPRELVDVAGLPPSAAVKALKTPASVR